MNYETLYNAINDRYFDSELPAVDIIEFDAFDAWTYASLSKYFKEPWTCVIDGLCIPTRKNYIIGIASDLPKMEKIATLVHEMIHVWQGVKGYNDIHGKSFKRKCQEIMESI